MTQEEIREVESLRRKGYGYVRIGKALGISPNTIKSYCRRHIGDSEMDAFGLVAFSGETTSCENCGQPIHQLAKRKKRRFCCDKCRNAWWNKHLDQVNRKKMYTFICPQCGREFQIYGDSRRKYCSHACYIAARFPRRGKNRVS